MNECKSFGRFLHSLCCWLKPRECCDRKRPQCPCPPLCGPARSDCDQQALIRAGGQDIATQLRERRIRLQLNQWLADSQFPFLWDCVTVNGFCPHKRKFLLLVLFMRVCGGKAINCIPAHAKRTFLLFSFLWTGTQRFTYIPFGHLPVQRKRNQKKCCAGISCCGQLRPAGKNIKEMWSGRLSQQLLLFLIIFYNPGLHGNESLCDT